MNKIALVTGASSGIGKKIVQTLANNNIIVFAATRDIKKIEKTSNNIVPIELNLDNDESIQKCILEIDSKYHKIDYLINNAGYGYYGPIENTDINEAYKQFNINLFGMAKLIKLLIPMMRQQKSGKIINISSILGKIGSKFGAWYCASKYALEGFSDCLRMEVKDFGIDVVIIEPGIIKTDWWKISSNHLKNVVNKTIYESEGNKIANVMIDEKNTKKATDPQEIANLVLYIINKKNPKTRYVKGFLSKSLLFLHKILGDKLYDKFYNWVIQKFSNSSQHN